MSPARIGQPSVCRCIASGHEPRDESVASPERIAELRRLVENSPTPDWGKAARLYREETIRHAVASGKEPRAAGEVYSTPMSGWTPTGPVVELGRRVSEGEIMRLLHNGSVAFKRPQREYRPSKDVMFGFANRDNRSSDSGLSRGAAGPRKRASTPEWRNSNSKRKFSPRRAKPKQEPDQDYMLPGSAGTGREGGRGAQPLGGIECWRCGRLPTQPDYKRLLHHAEKLHIRMDAGQARAWSAHFSNITAACNGLDRLAVVYAERRRARQQKPLPPAPPLEGDAFKFATARAVRGPELVAWLEERGYIPPVPKSFESRISRWRKGMTADVFSVDDLLCELGLHLYVIPADLLLDKLPRARASARRVEIEEVAV